jgi:hypothetical protein
MQSKSSSQDIGQFGWQIVFFWENTKLSRISSALDSTRIPAHKNNAKYIRTIFLMQYVKLRFEGLFDWSNKITMS